MYIIINVFVVLNMLIAIISDAYAEVSQEIKHMPNVRLGNEIKHAIKQKFYRLPFVQPIHIWMMKWHKKSVDAIWKRRARIGHKEHDSTSYLQHRVARLAYELERKRDVEMEKEMERKAMEMEEENMASTKHLRKVEARLERVERLLCQLANVEYVSDDDPTYTDQEEEEEAKKNEKAQIVLPKFVKTETNMEFSGSDGGGGAGGSVVSASSHGGAIEVIGVSGRQLGSMPIRGSSSSSSSAYVVTAKGKTSHLMSVDSDDVKSKNDRKNT